MQDCVSVAEIIMAVVNRSRICYTWISYTDRYFSFFPSYIIVFSFLDPAFLSKCWAFCGTDAAPECHTCFDKASAFHCLAAKVWGGWRWRWGSWWECWAHCKRKVEGFCLLQVLPVWGITLHTHPSGCYPHHRADGLQWSRFLGYILVNNSG